jgi:hypothetical protein
MSRGGENVSNKHGFKDGKGSSQHGMERVWQKDLVVFIRSQ